jgi:exodeoxyribonuclease VII large subunit
MNPKTPTTLSVSELNRKARQLLEMHLNPVWVEGELTNLATPSSGHWYFTLKDANAQVRCAMFKPVNNRVGFKPKEGSLIRVRAKVSLYEGRGDYQLIVEMLEDTGIGALQRAFELLKKKLSEEGLFSDEFKQPLPAYPKQIGVITSPTGAAIHDIVTVLKRRYPMATVTVIPVAVQGKQAAAEIAAAITRANNLKPADGLKTIDVLIVGRGGGSLEDLWAFNEEIVARAIFASEIPIVSAVGHEIDFSIADFVADVRAATPSAAAELVTPDWRTMLAAIDEYENFFTRFIQQHLRESRQQLHLLYSKLKHPGQALQEQVQHLDHLEIRLQKSLVAALAKVESQLQQLSSRLQGLTLVEKIKGLRQRTLQLGHQLQLQGKSFYQQKQQKLSALSHWLNNVSPLNTLNRGYAIVSNKQHRVIQDADNVSLGERISARLKNGSIDCEVIEIKK